MVLIQAIRILFRWKHMFFSPIGLRLSVALQIIWVWINRLIEVDLREHVEETEETMVFQMESMGILMYPLNSPLNQSIVWE